jgi:glutamate N-acetyltransferase / amino-acid N-acetyltransferase
MKSIHGGVVAAKGFQCAGIACGIKSKKDALDLGMILSDVPAVVAGVFTKNRIASPTVTLNRERVGRRKVRGVVVNAGNANTCTGKRGMNDAIRMAELSAAATGTKPEDFLVASTGIIGHHLPMDNVTSGIATAGAALGKARKCNDALSQAIMTTDLVPKSCAMELTIGGKKVRIGGVAKGSGMIAPNMATMLSFLTTDCAISSPLLRKALRDVADRTYNAVTVDGDSSTNDSVILMANGLAGNAPITKAGRAYDAFLKGLYSVAEYLAKSIARDGEGATKLVTVRVTGGRSDGDVKCVARSIAESPLVKTAVHGCDPNWGRIICAAGYSGALVDGETMRLKINGVQLFSKGRPTKVEKSKLASCMKPEEVVIHLDLGQGKREATVWTCDFSKEYITINAEYHT